MSKYVLKRKTFTKYDDTDALKRMKDSDILAENEKEAPSYRPVIRDAALGAVAGAAALSALRGSKGKGTLKSNMTTGAILGGLAMGAAGLRKRSRESDDREFYNTRLRYAKRHAKRRERMDWHANMTQRDGYSF